MKATLEFTLPEESEEFALAHRGSDYAAILDRLTQNVRSWRKHGHEFADAGAVLDAIWDQIHDMRSEYGIVD